MYSSLFNNFKYTSKEDFNYLINISNTYKLVYFEIPKTGCSTIKKTLQSIELNGKEIKKENVHNKLHSPLKGFFDTKIKEQKEILHTNDYFKFTFIRNPYNRILSAYLDKIVTNMWEKKRRAKGLGFEFEDEISFLDFLKAISEQDPINMDIHWKPQVYLLPNDLNQLNYIAKFENFQEEWLNLLKKFKQNASRDKHHLFKSQDVIFHQTNASNKIEQYYNEEEKSLVQEIYKLDFYTFNYDMDNYE